MIDLDAVGTATISALIPAGVIGGWAGVRRILGEVRQLRIDLTTHMQLEESDRHELHRQTEQLGQQTERLGELIAIRRREQPRRVTDSSDESWERGEHGA